MTTREAFDFAFGKEIEQREINRFKQALQAAHFPCIKRLEDFDFSAQPSIDPGTIQELASSNGLVLEKTSLSLVHLV